MLDLSLKELKVIEKMRGIKAYKSMSEDEAFSKARIKKIRKEFNESRHKSFKSRMNEIRINLYEIENKKNLSATKIREIKESVLIMMTLNIEE